MNDAHDIVKLNKHFFRIARIFFLFFPRLVNLRFQKNLENMRKNHSHSFPKWILNGEDQEYPFQLFVKMKQTTLNKILLVLLILKNGVNGLFDCYSSPETIDNAHPISM